MKQIFEEPEMEMVVYSVNDVIATSSNPDELSIVFEN